ncbi:MAG: flavodoxin [Bacteroides sp.]|nr:flavodoxin [Bacteroides sp.]
MKYYVLLALAIAAMTVMVACGSKKQNSEKEVATSPKYLVLYYSQTGTTKAVAEELQRKLGADIESIEAVEPYSGTYEQTIERSKNERETGVTPKVNPLKSNLDEYDVIFLGYPVWFGTYALPIAGLIKDCDFAGKKIVPFCTFGSGGLDASVKDLKAALPKADILSGYGVRTARLAAMPKEVDRFLKENKYVEGEVEALPDYSAQQPVTEEEKTIFDAACSSYKYPLGTPVTVGKRVTADGTDYLYVVKSKNPAGEEATCTIYVTVGNEQDAKPEFTQVVR